MMTIIKQGAAAALEPRGTVGIPLSEPACRLAGIDQPFGTAAGLEAGLWECTPGRFRRQVQQAEVMHILAGSASFEPDDGGPPIRLEAGDTVLCTARTGGVWDIRTTLRKFYLLLPEPLVPPPSPAA